MAKGDSVKDEIKQQHKYVKEELDFFGKVKYFFYYYKIHTAVTLVVLVALIYVIHFYATKKDPILQVAIVNGYPQIELSEMIDEYTATIPFDPEEQEVTIDDTYYINTEMANAMDDQNAERLYIFAYSEELDVCLVDESYFPVVADAGYVEDLSKLFTEEQLAKYEDKFVYWDSPNDMVDGEELIAIDISDAPKIVSTKCFPDKKAYFTIILNSEYKDNAWAFLEYLYTP